MDCSLSIVIPVLEEASGIAAFLQALAPLRGRGVEVIVVDGGSRDATRDLASRGADYVITSRAGRAVQMNAGARVASASVLLFLHADTRLPSGADQIVLRGLEVSGRAWGRFDVTIDGRHPLLAVISHMINMRSRVTGIATGDQGIFVTRGAFDAVAGYPEIPLMEDVALSSRLKRISRPLCLAERLVTSGRRWEKHGVIRTVLLMWRLRLSYFFGADPAALARTYGYVPPSA